ncbi:MAG: PTS sugar transporter subunit IIA [Chthoniobacterales bacterium]|nr:PTS sugar transporter subunit IIA [Chthoniobacterales bacterium]
MRIRFSNILFPDHIALHLEANTLPTALQTLLNLLKGDLRISDFARFESAILNSNPPAVSNNYTCIIIAHCRLEFLHQLVMAAGRPINPFPIPNSPQPLRLLFIAGIPLTLNNEYLRIVGAIARICSDPNSLSELLSSKTPYEFIQTLDSHLDLV